MSCRHIIQTDALSYSYRQSGPVWILKDLNLSIRTGDYLLICGTSGCGKSTLSRTFNGLIPHFYTGRMRGTVNVAGVSTRDRTLGDLFSEVAMIFQNPEAQLFGATVEGEIAFGLESLGLPREEIRVRIMTVSEDLGLTKLLPRAPRTLSGGEQYLVAAAACLALRPRLIILDEPYANLDHMHVRQLRQLLISINQRGTAVAICEHRLAPTLPDINRMVVLHQGKIVLDGPPAEILSQDVNRYGLALPPVVQAGLKLNLDPLPLTPAALKTAADPAKLAALPKPEDPLPPPETARPLLQVRRVSATRNSQAVLKDISFSLSTSECLALVGANGAGKTTLARYLLGLRRPDAGTIRIMDQPADRMKTSERARYMGLAFQNPHNQFFKSTVREEIDVGPRALDNYDARWIDTLIALFRLSPLLDRPPYRLSTGEKKRVAFAAALAANPPILILDEPTAGQDACFRQALGRCLDTLRSRGQAVLIITHDLTFAAQHAHRWLIMADGQIIARGAPATVMADRAAMTVAGLDPKASFNIFPGR